MKKKKNRSKDKFIGKYYVITSVYRRGIPDNVFGFYVAKRQVDTKHRYLVKLYRCSNIKIKRNKDGDYTWWGPKDDSQSFYTQIREEEKTGFFPISFADFIELMNNDMEESNQKDIVKIRLRDEYEIEENIHLMYRE